MPADKKKRNEILESLKNETRTIIIYEAPHHLLKTLRQLLDTIGDRNISLCRELTKKYETIHRNTISGAIDYFTANEPRGEFVLVIQGKNFREVREEEEAKWENVSVEEHLKIYMDKGMTKKEAMKEVAKDRGVSKRDIYQMTLDI